MVIDYNVTAAAFLPIGMEDCFPGEIETTYKRIDIFRDRNEKKPGSFAQFMNKIAEKAIV